MELTTLLSELQDAGQAPHTLVIAYQKSDGGTTERLIEPYVLKREHEYLLRAYQLEPEEGWRFFVLNRIVAVRRGQPFKPRAAISLDLNPREKPGAAATADHVAQYRELVLEVLADMRTDGVEAQALAAFREANGIAPEQMRGVHYSVFADCLKEVVQDGLVSESEQRQLAAVNECLRAIGAGILDR